MCVLKKFLALINVRVTISAVYQSAVASLQKSHQIGRALFSCRVHKFNRFNKLAERCLLVTESQIYKLDAATFKPLKKPTMITEVSAP